MWKEVGEELARLVRRLEAEAFSVRDAPFFAASGIAVARRKPAPTTESPIRLADPIVFVYQRSKDGSFV